MSSPPPSALSDSEELSPGDFTDLYVAYLKNSTSDAEFERIADLEIKVRVNEGGAHSIFLDNAYNEYRNDPGHRDEILETYIGSFLEVSQGHQAPIDPDRIVPVIKDLGWIEGIQATIRERGGKWEDLPAYVSDRYNSELVIFYAEDSPRNIRYLTEEALTGLDLDRGTLRERAIENLMGLIDGYQIRGGDGLYMITAGGDYETSLLLVDQVWDSGTLEVEGDFVVTIPARDLLIVTGSESRDALDRLRKMASDSAANFSYSLTPVLFIRKGGVFEVFEG